jgi:replicative superfamily II helicase
VENGIGCHHAGLHSQDRRTLETAFIAGDLPVLIATSTLAMGVSDKKSKKKKK